MWLLLFKVFDVSADSWPSSGIDIYINVIYEMMYGVHIQVIGHRSIIKVQDGMFTFLGLHCVHLVGFHTVQYLLGFYNFYR